MGNKVTQKTSFNIANNSELKEFVSSINVSDGFFVDANLSISSKCLVIINNLINHLNSIGTKMDMDDEMDNYQCDISPGLSIKFDKESLDRVSKLKFNCQLMRKLFIFNSNMNTVEEYIELNNFVNLVSLHLKNLPIKFVQHLKLHRATLLKLCVHNCISDLESLIELCGGDQSFSGSWNNLLHLDVRYNKLKTIDNSVSLLSNLTVLDVSRNDLESISFIEKIPTLVCLNASYNFIKILPNIINHCLKVLIIGYNYLEGFCGIEHFKWLSTLNVSFNMISTTKYLSNLTELDFLKDLILKGNPICTLPNYRISVLKVVSPRVMISFALDGRIFTNKERTLLQKLSIIAIDPPIQTDGDFHSQVAVIKPRHFETSSPSLRRPVRVADIDKKIISQQNFDQLSQENLIVKSEHSEPQTEKIFHSNTDTDNKTTILSTSDAPTILENANKLKPFYHGENSSVLTCISHKNRESFLEVSLQLFEHKFMAVDEKCRTVNNVDLWTMLYVNHESYSNNVLKLVFYKEMLSEENDAMKIVIRLLEFTSSSESDKFLEQLQFYLEGFSSLFEEDTNNLQTLVFMKCSKCKSYYQFHSNIFRPISCKTCESHDFIFVNANPVTNLVGVEESRRESNISGATPGRVPWNNKHPTSELLRNAISCECIVRDTDNESGTSYHTALNGSNFRGSVSILNSTSGSNLDMSIKEEEINFCDYENSINLEIPVNYQNISQLMCDSQTIVPNLPDETEDMKYLVSLVETSWIVNEPLSNVNIHMDNITKIDDRIKIHFLTNVMHSNEDLKAAFKSNIIYKTTSIATEAIIILSNFRIMFYNWVDKNSPSFEDCLKLVVEFKLMHLIQVDDCLNNQWIELQFKNKQHLSLLVGNIKTTRNVVQILTDIASLIVSKLTVRQLKDIGKFNSNQIIEDMVKAMNGDMNTIALENCQYYLIKSCSLMQIDVFENGYAPKIIGFQSEHIFFINLKIKNKPRQINFELYQTLSLYIVTSKIVVDSNNPHHCQLKISENNIQKSIDIEFMSPAARSQALLHLNKLWLELYQASFEFQIMSTAENRS